MTIYVDELHDYGEMVKWPARRWGTIWCHMSCDGDDEALHQMAQRLGLRRSYAQHMDRPDHYYHHYDLIPSKRTQAIKLGAVFKPARQAAKEHLWQQQGRIRCEDGDCLTYCGSC